MINHTSKFSCAVYVKSKSRELQSIPSFRLPTVVEAQLAEFMVHGDR